MSKGKLPLTQDFMTNKLPIIKSNAKKDSLTKLIHYGYARIHLDNKTALETEFMSALKSIPVLNMIYHTTGAYSPETQEYKKIIEDLIN